MRKGSNVRALSIRVAWTAVVGCSMASAATPPHRSPQDSTATNAIVGTGKVKTDAIVGTGVQAIVGTGADAIVGTGVQAIVGTGVQAIVGTGGPKTDAIVGTGRTVTFRGLIEQVDFSKLQVSFLGQTLRMPSLKDTDTVQSVQTAIADGRYVELVVEVGIKAQLTVRGIHVFDERYVPGASRVTVAGSVSKNDAAIAHAKVGEVSVDYSPLLTTSTVQHAPGDVILVDGIQPSYGSAIIANSIEGVN
jgi:hypothetical protein